MVKLCTPKCCAAITNEVLSEYNLKNDCVDLFLRTFPNQSLTPKQLHDLFELKRVPKDAKENEFEAKFEKAKAQVLKYKTGDYAHFRAVAVCFRGNLDFKIEVFE